MSQTDVLLFNGRVRTLDPDRPAATAVAISDGTLTAVGSDSELLELRGPRTETIDLGGAAVTPGIVDSHSHPFPSIMFQGGLDLMGAGTLEAIREEIAAAAARARPGEWITGFGLDYNVFADVGISGSHLADVAGDFPVLIRFVDFHTALATPLALERAGVDGPREFDEHAEIVCRDGVPTGELREAAAMNVVAAAMPSPTHSQLYELSVEHLRRMAAAGITGTHVMDGDLERLDLLRELEANGDLAIRVVSPFWVKPETDRDTWAAFAAAAGQRGRRWRAGVAKFFIDGVIDSGTAWLFEPDSEGDGCEPFWPDPGLYREAVAFMASRGLQCVTHACGDRAVHEALNAYREAPASAGRGQHRVEHIETLQPGDLPRFAAEGVTASMQAQHMMYCDPDRLDNWSRRLGPERCDRAFLTRSILATGAQVTLGSDWPVARFDPREGMAAARLRRPPGETGRRPYDDQAISALEALQGYTTWPARTVGETAAGGTLTVGKRGDLTVFAIDPVECDADQLPEDEVLLTVVDGEIVHRAIE